MDKVEKIWIEENSVVEQYSIAFPNLGIELSNVGKTIRIFGYDIAYYGIIIGVAMGAGILLAEREAKITGQKPEDYLDFAFYAIIFSIIGARLYYVFFSFSSWDAYKGNLLKIINIHEGGLAIYGGVIAAAITMYVFSKKRKLPFGKMADTACIGLVTGQIIGRWGNFFNREAFGEYTNGFFAMRLPIDAVRQSDISASIMSHVTDGTNYIQVHPTFLYESLWNIGVLILINCYKKHKHFEGEVFLIYVLGYGLGRAWIEGLRTDQLLLFSTGVPVSQMLAVILVVLSSSYIIWKRNQLSGRRE